MPSGTNTNSRAPYGSSSSEATSSMEPSIGLDASRLDLYEQTDSSGENNWANIWSKDELKQWQAGDPVTKVVINLKVKGEKPTRTAPGTNLSVRTASTFALF